MQLSVLKPTLTYCGTFFALLSVRAVSSFFLSLNHHQQLSLHDGDNYNLNSNDLFSKSSPSSSSPLLRLDHHGSRFIYISSTSLLMGKPKSGSVVDSYQSVSVNCKKCKTKLFRYKKKNGTKSNLIKCYVERISEDCQNLVAERQGIANGNDGNDWICPKCGTKFGRDALIHGRPAIKLVGGKTQMTKK